MLMSGMKRTIESVAVMKAILFPLKMTTDDQISVILYGSFTTVN